MVRASSLPSLALLLAPAVAAAADPRPAAAPLPAAASVPAATAAGPTALVTDLGLEDFAGAESIAAALRRADLSARGGPPPGLPLDLAVKGPCGRDAAATPLSAELRGRLERFDVAAGMLAAQDALHDGPTKWTGRIAIASERPAGSEAFELRTTLGRRDSAGVLGVEAGPRIERRLGHGATFFIDGKAQAQTQRATDSGWWSLRNLSPDAGSTVGVSAHTGLAR